MSDTEKFARVIARTSLNQAAQAAVHAKEELERAERMAVTARQKYNLAVSEVQACQLIVDRVRKNKND